MAAPINLLGISGDSIPPSNVLRGDRGGLSEKERRGVRGDSAPLSNRVFLGVALGEGRRNGLRGERGERDGGTVNEMSRDLLVETK